MQRPRWLGGRETNEGEGDGEAGAKSARNKPGTDPEDLSAAERSVRRTARKNLGERVGKAADEGSDKPGKEPEAKAEPEPAAKPRVESTAKPKPKPKLTPKPKVESKPRPRPKVRAEKRDLHRPRRQRDERPERSPSAKGEGKRSRDHDDEGAKARGRGKSKPESGNAARRKRKPLGPRVRAVVGGSAGALKRGGVETRKRIAAAAPKVGRRGLAAVAAIFAIFFELLGFVLNVLISAWRVVARPVDWFLTRLSRLTNAVSRLLTPRRVLAIVVAGAAVLLALSQYADYRSISIGNDAYSGVQNIAPPPETGRLQTGDAHSYVFVPIAVLCLLLLGGALTGRWRLCRLITLAGAAAIVVAFVVDRPAGLDTGATALAFDGVRATLLGGFYAQIAAGALLIGSSSLLARELRLTGATAPARPRRGRRRRRSEGERAIGPPDAGGIRA